MRRLTVSIVLGCAFSAGIVSAAAQSPWPSLEPAGQRVEVAEVGVALTFSDDWFVMSLDQDEFLYPGDPDGSYGSVHVAAVTPGYAETCLVGSLAALAEAAGWRSTDEAVADFGLLLEVSGRPAEPSSSPMICQSALRHSDLFRVAQP